MQRELEMNFIQLEGMRAGAVDQGRQTGTGSQRVAEDGRASGTGFRGGHIRQLPQRLKRGAEDTTAKRVEDAQFGLAHDFPRQIVECQCCTKFRQSPRRASAQARFGIPVGLLIVHE